MERAGPGRRLAASRCEPRGCCDRSSPPGAKRPGGPSGSAATVWPTRGSPCARPWLGLRAAVRSCQVCGRAAAEAPAPSPQVRGRGRGSAPPSPQTRRAPHRGCRDRRARKRGAAAGPREARPRGRAACAPRWVLARATAGRRPHEGDARRPRGSGPQPRGAGRWAANAARACAAASAVSGLLSGWAAGINLSPPRRVQSQARSHGAAGRAERGGAEGAVRAPRGSPGRAAPLPRAGRGLRAGGPGAAQSPQAPAGGVEAEARAAAGPGEWSDLPAGRGDGEREEMAAAAAPGGPGRPGL